MTKLALAIIDDDAPAEGFFGMIKRERINRRRYLNRGRRQRRRIRLHRTLPQPQDPAQARLPRRGTQCLNSTVRENGVEPTPASDSSVERFDLGPSLTPSARLLWAQLLAP